MWLSHELAASAGVQNTLGHVPDAGCGAWVGLSPLVDGSDGDTSGGMRDVADRQP